MKKSGVIVLVRSYPSEQQLPEAVKVRDGFCELIKKHKPSTKIEFICAVADQLSWLEYWESLDALQLFNQTYAGMSDLPVQFINTSKQPPSRQFFQELPNTLK